MKFMIAGLGSIGRRHLRHLVALGQEDIFLYRSYKSTLGEDEFSQYPTETDLDKALAHKPDAVIISNPTAFHLDVAIPAAQAGCHILIEKPISNNLERIDEFKSIIEEKQIQVLVGFQFRYHPGLKKIKEILTNEIIGRPISFRVHWGEYLPDWHPWEDYRQGYSARKDLGGGVVLTLTHPLDYLNMIFGGVAEVSAFTGTLGDLELDVEDTAEILLKYEQGVMGSVHLNYNQRPPRHTMEIVCTKGTIRFDNAGTAIEVYSAEEEGWHEYPFPVDFERDDLFREQMAHFLEIVQGKAKPVCTLEDGIQAQILALAVLQSAAAGRTISLKNKRNEK